MAKRKLVICQNSVKNELLEKQSGIVNNSYMDLATFINNLTYIIDKEAIFYISKEMNIKPAFAAELIDYIIYDSLFFDDPKLNYILNIKEKLIAKNLIRNNEVFISSLKNRDIVFYKCPLDSNLRYAIGILEDNNIPYSVENIKQNNPKKIRNVYKFNNLEEESRFVFNEIKKLLDNGVSTENIKIANYTSDYEFVFKRLSDAYNIPIAFRKHKNILSTAIAKELFELLKASSSFDELVAQLRIKYSNDQYLKRIINIINSYKLYNYNPMDTIELFKYELKKIKYDNIIYDNAIELIDVGQSNSNDYIFIVGFNNGLIPYVHVNKGYLSDDILAKMGLDTALVINKRTHDDIVDILNGEYIFTISYKMNTNFASFLPSTLIEELDYNVIEGPVEFGVNESEDLISFAVHLENYFKFQVVEDNFLDFIFDIDYYKFDNSWTGIFNSLDKLPKTISLSYSSMNEYIKCPFNYYLKYILKIQETKSRYHLDIGNYAHYILERCYNDDFDFDAVACEALKKVYKDNEPTNKELFFLVLIKELVRQLIEFNKLNEGMTIFSQRALEKEIVIEENEGKLIFTGKIDKLLYEEQDDYTYYAVIDYKTGKDVFDLKNIEHGFNLQLPVYLYLIKNSNNIPNPKLIGLYLQKIRLSDDNLGLKGYTINNLDLVKKVYNGALDTGYLSNLKLSKSGFDMRSSKVIKDEDIDGILETVDKHIKDTYQHIINGDFSIEPKLLDDKDMSCGHCVYKDICFKRFSNYRIIETEKEKNGGGSSEGE